MSGVRYRIVHLEDDPNDRELVAHVLDASGLDCEIVAVATGPEYERAIRSGADLILSDGALPGFDGGAARTLATACCPDVPFVYLTGSFEGGITAEWAAGAAAVLSKDQLDELPDVLRRLVAGHGRPAAHG